MIRGKEAQMILTTLEMAESASVWAVLYCEQYLIRCRKPNSFDIFSPTRPYNLTLSKAVYGHAFPYLLDRLRVLPTVHQGVGGGIYNKGDFTFSGPALFVDSRGTAIVNASPGTMK